MSSNEAKADGGALYNSGGNVLFVNSTLGANHNYGSYGGGINNYGGNITLRGSTVWANISDGNGGAIAST